MGQYRNRFYCRKQENKLYIQVVQDTSSQETEKREYGRLLDIKDNYLPIVDGFFCDW